MKGLVAYLVGVLLIASGIPLKLSYNTMPAFLWSPHYHQVVTNSSNFKCKMCQIPRTKRQMKEEIRKGTEVELSIDDRRGFHIVVGQAKFLVRFKSLKTYDGNVFLVEEFDVEHLMPCPLETVMVDCYGLNDKIGRTTPA